jgi:hypothetical protein
MRFSLGATQVDLDSATARTSEGDVSLTGNEVKVLRLLAERRGRAVPRDDLLVALGYRPTVVTRAVDQLVFRLRRKLEPVPDAPVWLVSEPPQGYRLAPEAAPAPRGRDPQLAHLRRLLDERGTVWVSGLPGAGRRTLAAAAGAPVDDRRTATAGAPAPGVVLADLPPPGAPFVRLGPLSPEDALALLERGVVDQRGTDLSATERAALPAVVAAADGLPGRLLAAAAAALLRPLDEVRLPPDPAVRELLDRLPRLRDALSAVVVFPGSFSTEEAAELGVDEGALGDAWRAGLLERVDGRLALPVGVRVWLPERAEAVATALAAWLPQALAAARAVTERGTAADDAGFLAWRERLVGRVGADPRWLPVHHAALALASELGPIPVGPADDPWTDAVATRRAWREGDLAAARASARRVSGSDLPPGVRAGALRLRAGADADAVAEAEALARAHPSPLTRGTAHLVAGVTHLQGDRSLSAARDALLAALAEFRSAGAARLERTAAYDLAICATRDGRAREAVGWFGAPAHPDARWMSIVLQLALEELPAAQALLDAQEAAGAAPRLCAVLRGSVALLRGDAGAAVAAADGARHLPVAGADHVHWVRPPLAAFGQLALGRPALGLAALDEPDPARAAPDLLALTRALLLAACGRIDEAKEAAALADHGPETAWRPHARALVAAVTAGGGPAALEATRRAYLGSPVRHAWLALAWAAHAPRTGGSHR